MLIDKEHKLREIFINQLESISNTDVVLMEDDIILCRDFKNKIENIIEKHPDEIINFYTKPFDYYVDEYKYCVFNQCTYFPKRVLKGIVEFYNNHKHYINLKLTPEDYVRIYINNRKVYSPRPCLVQHIDNKSILDKHPVPVPRRTPYFIDYLEDLGISYEEAGTEENTERLKDYMNKQFENIEEECNIVLYE